VSLKAALDGFLVRHAAVPDVPKSDIPPDTAERLKALGYLTDR
jgi:hypothetical protein